VIGAETLLIGAAAGALPTALKALPKPGDFAAVLSNVVGAIGAALPPIDGQTNCSGCNEKGVSVDSLKQQLQDATERLRSSIRNALESAGYDPATELRLTGDGFGGISIVGDTPNAIDLERALNDDPQIVEVFQAASALASLTHAIEQSERLWSAEGEQIPPAELLSDRFRPQPFFQLADDSVEIDFE
jgi:hypothetical protein